MTLPDKAEDRLKRAKVQLYDKAPFFSYLANHLTLVEEESLQPPTAGVDFRGKLYYHPDFIEDIDSESEIEGLMVHEILHLAFEGELRRDGRDKQLWNVAQDIVINHKVKQNGFDLPEEASDLVPDENGRLNLEKQFGYTFEDVGEHSFESVYDILKRQQQKGEGKQPGGGRYSGRMDEHREHGDGDGDGQQDQNQGQGSPGQGNPIEGEGEGEDGMAPAQQDAEEDAEKWRKLRDKAQQHAKQRGNTPAGIEDEVDEIEKAYTNWRQVIQRVVTQAIPHDFTYQRPSKKSRATGYYMPRTKKEGLDVVCVLDTSGSISDEELEEFYGEMEKMAHDFPSVNLTVIQHDMDVQKVDTIKNASKRDILDLDIKGRGGTSHIPVFKHIENELNRAEVVVAFTDGYSKTPESLPYNVGEMIWVVNNYQDHDCIDKVGGKVIRTEARL